MKYSIRGSLNIEDESSVIEIINQYVLWRLTTKRDKILLTEDERFTFEVWLNTVEDKDKLFNKLKSIVDEYGEIIDWHECSHDEEVSRPCVIAEEYRGE